MEAIAALCELQAMVHDPRFLAGTSNVKTRGDARNFPTENRGAGPSDKGAEMTEKWRFRVLFCRILTDESPKFPPTGGGG